MIIAIVDDSANDRQILVTAVQTAFTELGIPIDKLVEYTDGEDFVNRLTDEAFDLIFLDIYMNTLSGIETAKKIRCIDSDVRIVFATSSNEFASESFAVNACHYILKPVTVEQIRSVISRIDLKDLRKNKYLTLPDGQKLLVRSIVYTDYSDHVIHIHLSNDTSLSTRLQHSRLEALLTVFPQFFCCSKGILVNFDHVQTIDDSDFIMKDGSRVPISRRKKKATMELFQNFLFKRLKETD